MNRIFNRLPTAPSARERRILLLAIPLALVLAGLLAWQSLAGRHHEAEQRLARALEDAAWLQSQHRAIAAGVSCAGPRWQAGQLESQARRYGIRLQQPPRLSGGQVSLDMAGADGNRVIEFVQALACQGAVIESLSLASGADRGAVSGQLVALLP